MNRIIITRLLATLCLALAFLTAKAQASQRQPVNVILDADFGSSTDDLFALMMCHHFIDERRMNLKGIIVDREGPANAQVVDVINTYFGKPHIKIGVERNGVKNPRCFIPYSGICELKDADGNYMFKRTINDVDKLPDGYMLYRALLSQAADKSISIVAIGFVTTLAQLFESKPDDISPLSGLDLFEKKVKAVYIQSGRFEAGDSLCGYNMRAASRQSAIFYDKFPKSVELVMSPSNVGDMIDYHPQDVLVDLSYTLLNPIKAVYTNYHCDTGQRMWDTNCLVNAVLGDGEYNLSPRGWVQFIDKGEQSLMLFTPDAAGNARYQLPGDSYFASQKLMEIRRYNRITPRPAPFTIEAPQPQLTGGEAAQWARQRIAQLADKYMGVAGNTLDPDDVRAMFRPLGYTGPNWQDYAQAEQLVVDTLFSKMLANAQRTGKNSLVIITGPPSSGKSTAARELNLKDAGLIYDAALSEEGRLLSVIETAKKAGISSITVVPVYNDVLTCFKNAVNKGKATWRYTALDYMVSSFRANANKLQLIRQAHPDVAIRPVDCTGNQGAKQVSLKKALKWNYEVSSNELNSLLAYLLQQIESGSIDDGSVEAATGNVLAINGLDSANMLLAQRISQEVQRITQAYKLRY